MQPKITGEIGYFLRLFQRAVTFHALPAPGGLEDQDEWTMRVLDAIAAQNAQAHEEHHKAKEREQSVRNKIGRGIRRIFK